MNEQDLIEIRRNQEEIKKTLKELINLIKKYFKDESKVSQEEI